MGLWVYLPGLLFVRGEGGSIKEDSLALGLQHRAFPTGCALPNAKESSIIPQFRPGQKKL